MLLSELTVDQIWHFLGSGRENPSLIPRLCEASGFVSPNFPRES